MRVCDLFSGIGGFSLGLEAAGMTTVQFVESDPYCQAVLQKHWPEVPCHDDIRTFKGERGSADVVCGGFPCQDISAAGTGKGLDGDRSGLWTEFARAIRDIRPRYAIVENSPMLLSRGLDRILIDLDACGYDAEWSVVSACSLGHSHMRRRLFIVAYPNGQHGREGVWNTAAQSEWALQIGNDFEGARTCFEARLANPSALYRDADGVAFGPQRNHAIGNAVVPQVVEAIGRAIMEAA